MAIWRKLESCLSWLPWYRRQARDADLARELRDHLDLEADAQTAAGLSPQDAAHAAHRALGNTLRIEEDVRAARGFQQLETLAQDIRFALRMLRKSPGFATVAILTLALGIGANTAIFTVINTVLLNPLPYKDPQEIVAMAQNDSLMNIIDIQRQMRSFSQGGGINVSDMDYTSGTTPVRVHAGWVDAGLLATLGVPPMLGRIISPEEDVKGGPRAIVLSHSFWQNFFGSDPQPLGKTITLSGNDYTVIGVMPSDFVLPRQHADIFVSLWVGDSGAASERDLHFMHTYWRLKPGVTLAQAQAEMSALDRRLAEQYPDTEHDRHKTFLPLRELVAGDLRPALLILFGAVGLVLLIACANFAGLLVARSAARRSELTIRAALGASRARLIFQAVTESVLLSLIGGLLGLLLAHWGTALLLSLKPAALQRFTSIHVDTRVLLFVLGVSLLTGIVFGIAPALSTTRSDFAESMKEGGRGATAGRSTHRLRQVLVISEFALALVLLVGAGLLIKGFSRLRSVNPGFNPQNVMTMYLTLPPTRYHQIPPQTQFRRELLARLNSLPGVQAAMITDLPLGGNYVDHHLVMDGRPVEVGAEPLVQTLSVMGDYFRVMQIPIRTGRAFTEMDREGQPLVAVVNEEFVKEFFPHLNPIGARIDWNRTDEHQWMTIVGVAADVKDSALNQPADPAVYAPFSQSDERWRSFMTLVIRPLSPSPALIDTVKQQIWSIDRQIPVSDIQPMTEFMAVSIAQERFNMLLLGIFASLALLLAAVGIYGLMAYSVNQRTHEIGVRVAVGAQRRDVLRLILREGAKLSLFGTAIGIVAALGLTRLMASLLFEVKPTDPLTFLTVVCLLCLVALLACYLPARRAMRVDPMVALRYE